MLTRRQIVVFSLAVLSCCFLAVATTVVLVRGHSTSTASETKTNETVPVAERSEVRIPLNPHRAGQLADVGISRVEVHTNPMVRSERFALRVVSADLDIEYRDAHQDATRFTITKTDNESYHAFFKKSDLKDAGLNESLATYLVDFMAEKAIQAIKAKQSNAELVF